MGIMVYSLLWVMQDFVHQQYLGYYIGVPHFRKLPFTFRPSSSDSSNPARELLKTQRA